MTWAEPTNITGFSSMIQYSNSVTNNWFAIGFTITLFVIVLMYMVINSGQLWDSIIIAGTITTIVTVLLTVLGVVPSYLWLAYTVILGVGVVVKYFADN